MPVRPPPPAPPPPPPTGGDLPFAAGRAVPVAALRFAFTRASGPGGQNVNKVNSRATLTVDLADLSAVLPADAAARLPRLAGAWLAADPPRLVMHAADHRSQLANRRACRDRLRRLLQQAMVRPRTRRATRPSRGAVERRLKTKRIRAERKRTRGRGGRED